MTQRVLVTAPVALIVCPAVHEVVAGTTVCQLGFISVWHSRARPGGG